MRALIVAILVFCSPLAFADDAKGRAKEHYQRGAAAYEHKEYETAIVEYQRSLEALERAPTLYALGLAAEAAHRDEIAADAFRRYLAAAPSAPAELRDHATAYVREYELRQQRLRDEIQRATRTPQPTPAPPPEPRKPAGLVEPTPAPTAVVRRTDSRRPVGIAAVSLLAVSVAFAASASGLVGHAHALDTTPATSVTNFEDLGQRADRERTASWILYGVAGAALVGASAAFGVWMHRRPSSVSVGIQPLPGGGIVVIGGGL